MTMRKLSDLREINVSELGDVSGGVTLQYGKLEVVYTQQKPDGTANHIGGDPDEGGQLHFQARLR
jgi:hypothetical protein